MKLIKAMYSVNVNQTAHLHKLISHQFPFLDSVGFLDYVNMKL